MAYAWYATIRLSITTYDDCFQNANTSGGEGVAQVPEASLYAPNRLGRYLKRSGAEKTRESEAGLPKPNFTGSKCFAKWP